MKIIIISSLVSLAVIVNGISQEDWCGPAGRAIGEYIPDRWYFSSLGKFLNIVSKGKIKARSVYVGNACKNHDLCYQKRGKNRKRCDDIFLKEMIQSCEGNLSRWSFAARNSCIKKAMTNHKAVRLFGKKYYKREQGH